MANVFFERDVFEKVSDQIIHKLVTYNTETMKFVVQDVKSERTFSHQTSIDLRYLSFNKDADRWGVDPDVYRYLRDNDVVNISYVPSELSKLFTTSISDQLIPIAETIIKINSGLLEVEIEEDDDSESSWIKDPDNKFGSIMTDAFIINGRPNFVAINEMAKIGFQVYPVERDSFGWLIGGVKTNKGVITFG